MAYHDRMLARPANWAFGAILLLALQEIALDVGTLMTMVLLQRGVIVPDDLRYAMAATAAVLAVIGVHQAVRLPPVKDIEVGIVDCRRSSTATRCFS